ncbi:MAG: glyoxalase, partial [Thermoleophilia bacterium]|nr:glyoxalase [Thermoleophilia bacterium]
EVEKPEPLRVRGGVWFRVGEQQLHVGVARPFAPARKAHPAFRVAEYERLLGAVRSAGVEVEEDGSIPGLRRCFITDPWENRIELVAVENSG